MANFSWKVNKYRNSLVLWKEKEQVFYVAAKIFWSIICHGLFNEITESICLKWYQSMRIGVELHFFSPSDSRRDLCECKHWICRFIQGDCGLQRRCGSRVLVFRELLKMH